VVGIEKVEESAGEDAIGGGGNALHSGVPAPSKWKITLEGIDMREYLGRFKTKEEAAKVRKIEEERRLNDI
jgi:hypothetical protein